MNNPTTSSEEPPLQHCGIMKYLIAFIPDGGKFSLFSPDFPEFDSCGDDFHDAMHMASDCLRICVEEYRREGRALPEPCDEETARKRVASALAEVGFVPEGEITYRHVPVPTE